MNNTYNSVPVLLILFNRPEYLLEMTSSLNKVNPSKIYIHIDGPRDSEDSNKIKEIKKMINKINPNIDKEIFSQDKNLGCGLGMVTAIDWFFENEDFGIILEDDCIPHQSFYEYCNKLLKELKDDKSIFMISGDNGGEIVPSKYFNNNEIMSVPIPLIWGWATWRDRWKDYEYNKPNLSFLSLYRDLKDFKSFERFFLINYFFKLKNYKSLNTWDIHLFYKLIITRKYCIIPRFNLVRNIGFGEKATHTKELTFRSNAEMKNINIKNTNYTNSFKKLNSRMVYLLQSNLESKVVHNRSLFFIRIIYLKGRFSYLNRSLVSKLKKTIRI